jgi:hypothetical protein
MQKNKVKPLLAIILLLACYPRKADNCAMHQEVVHTLVKELLTDRFLVREGSILPPSPKNDSNKPLALHVEIKDRYAPEVVSYIHDDFKTDVVFDSCKTNSSGLTGFVQDNVRVSADTAVYSNISFHMMGTLTIAGVYISKPGSHPVKCYVDIIRRSSLRSKSQFNDVVEFTLENKKWVKTAWKTYAMS